MIGNKIVEKDERTTFIENVSYKFGYKFITFALIFDALYRQRKFDEEPWDLYIIIIISGLLITVYQYKQKILGKAWVKRVTLTFIAAIIFIFLLIWLLLSPFL